MAIPINVNDEKNLGFQRMANRLAVAEPCRRHASRGSRRGSPGGPNAFEKTALGTKRVPFVLELLVAGGEGKGGRGNTIAGNAVAVNAAAVAGIRPSDGSSTLYTEGGRQEPSMPRAALKLSTLDIVINPEPCHSAPAKVERPRLLRTLARAGLKANPCGGWTRTEPCKKADILRDG